MGLRHINRKESGFGLFFGLIQWIAFLYGWPRFAAFIWPTYLKIKSDYNISDANYFIICGMLEVTLILVVGNIYYFILYKGNYKFIEQYKAVEDPWPW